MCLQPELFCFSCLEPLFPSPSNPISDILQAMFQMLGFFMIFFLAWVKIGVFFSWVAIKMCIFFGNA